jgi:hypothetical protein
MDWRGTPVDVFRLRNTLRAVHCIVERVARSAVRMVYKNLDGMSI